MQRLFCTILTFCMAASATAASPGAQNTSVAGALPPARNAPAAPVAALPPAQLDMSLSAAPETLPPEYLVQPGDMLTVTVWKDQNLTGDVLVRPDGGLSFPLVGDLDARSKTVSELRNEIAERLQRYIPSPVVTVAVKLASGNHIYVVGKVQRPGEYPIVRPVDVMQALSIAGGTTPYAALNSIVILHRENGVQKAFHFRYSDVAHGRDLSQNILLQSGDTVVVP
jgi:polysaccharide biosynthesis/export protein